MHGSTWEEMCTENTMMSDFLDQIQAVERADRRIQFGTGSFLWDYDDGPISDFFVTDCKPVMRIWYIQEMGDDSEPDVEEQTSSQLREDSGEDEDSEENSDRETYDDGWDGNCEEEHDPNKYDCIVHFGQKNEWLIFFDGFETDMPLGLWLRNCTGARKTEEWRICGKDWVIEYADKEALKKKCGEVCPKPIKSDRDTPNVWICQTQGDFERYQAEIAKASGASLGEPTALGLKAIFPNGERTDGTTNDTGGNDSQNNQRPSLQERFELADYSTGLNRDAGSIEMRTEFTNRGRTNVSQLPADGNSETAESKPETYVAASRGIQSGAECSQPEKIKEGEGVGPLAERNTPTAGAFNLCQGALERDHNSNQSDNEHARADAQMDLHDADTKVGESCTRTVKGGTTDITDGTVEIGDDYRNRTQKLEISASKVQRSERLVLGSLHGDGHAGIQNAMVERSVDLQMERQTANDGTISESQFDLEITKREFRPSDNRLKDAEHLRKEGSGREFERDQTEIVKATDIGLGEAIDDEFTLSNDAPGMEQVIYTEIRQSDDLGVAHDTPMEHGGPSTFCEDSIQKDGSGEAELPILAAEPLVFPTDRKPSTDGAMARVSGSVLEDELKHNVRSTLLQKVERCTRGKTKTGITSGGSITDRGDCEAAAKDAGGHSLDSPSAIRDEQNARALCRHGIMEAGIRNPRRDDSISDDVQSTMSGNDRDHQGIEGQTGSLEKGPALKKEITPTKTPELAKGSQAYREQQTQKRREREARQAEYKREMLLQEATAVTTVIFRGEKFSTTKLSNCPPNLLWRHFHRWVRSFSGISRENQKFTQYDDREAETLRKFQDPESELFQKIGGKTLRLLTPHKKRKHIVHWRFRHFPPTIPTIGRFSRPLKKRDIAIHGSYASFHRRSACAPPVRTRVKDSIGGKSEKRD
jgi:hypothetical protein